MWKNLVQPDRPHNTVEYCACVLCWITKTTHTHTHRICSTYCFSNTAVFMLICLERYIISTLPDLLDLRSIFWVNLTFGLSDQKITLYTAVLISLTFVCVIQNLFCFWLSLWIQYNSVSLFWGICNICKKTFFINFIMYELLVISSLFQHGLWQSCKNTSQFLSQQPNIMEACCYFLGVVLCTGNLFF